LKCDKEPPPDTLKKSSGKMKSDIARLDPLICFLGENQTANMVRRIKL